MPDFVLFLKICVFIMKGMEGRRREREYLPSERLTFQMAVMARVVLGPTRSQNFIVLSLVTERGLYTWPSARDISRDPHLKRSSQVMMLHSTVGCQHCRYQLSTLRRHETPPWDTKILTSESIRFCLNTYTKCTISYNVMFLTGKLRIYHLFYEIVMNSSFI